MKDIVRLEPDEKFMDAPLEKRNRLIDQYNENHEWYTYSHMANIINKKFKNEELTPIETALLKSNFTLFWDVKLLQDQIKDLEKKLNKKDEIIKILKGNKEGFKMHVRINPEALRNAIVMNPEISSADKGFILSCVSLLSMEGSVLKDPQTKRAITTASELAKVLKIPKSTVLDRMNSLIEKGLMKITEKGIVLDPNQNIFLKLIDEF